MGKTGKKLFGNLLGSGKNESRGIARVERPITEETLLATRGKSVDLVFVIDTTGSMSDKIKSLLQTAAKFVDRFGRLQMDSRIAIVAFGDLTVKGDKIVATTFTPNIETTKNSLQKIPRYSGGGNRGESALEALQKALALEFRDRVVKVIVLLTDEPALETRNLKVGMVIEQLKQREVLTFVVSTPEKYYKEMAARTGGKWYKISAKTDFTGLLEMFGDIADKVSETVEDVYRIGDGRVSDYLRLNAPNSR